MVSSDMLIAISMFLALALGLSALIVFVPDVVKTLSDDTGKEGAHKHQWSKAPLPLATGAVLFTGITIVGVITG